MDAEESDVPSWHTIARKPFVSRVEVEISYSGNNILGRKFLKNIEDPTIRYFPHKGKPARNTWNECLPSLKGRGRG